MEAFIFFGAFILPLLDSELVPAVLALLLILGLGEWGGSIRNPIWAAAFGWLASWTWRLEGAHLWRLVDLALVGPGLALGAAANRSRSLQAGLLAGGTVCALAALGQTFMGRAAPFHWTSADWPWERASGTLGNPNVAGAFFAALLPFALAFERPRWLRRPLCMILGIALLVTGSRGGWIAAFAAVACFLWVRRSPFLPSLLALAPAALILPWPPGARLLAGLSLRDPTAVARFAVWRRAIRLFLERPAAGWGFEAPLGWAPHPHNLLLEILVGGGLLAAAGFVPLALLLERIILFRREFSRAAALASLASLLVFGIADAVLGTPVLAALFWLDVGMVMGEGSVDGETGAPAAPRPAGRLGESGDSRGRLPPGCGVPPRTSSARDNPEPRDGAGGKEG